MAFFNKVLASIGIGAAKVDTKLSQSSIKAGDVVEGMVEIKGGSIEQNIDEIYLSINTTYEKEVDDKIVHKQASIATIKLNEPFVIMPEATKTIPFQFQLPINTPISAGSTKVWLQTGVDIKGAMDPTDKDMVTVLPHDLVDETLKVFSLLGFTIRNVKNEAASNKLRNSLPFIQEFEFVPTSSTYYGKFDEVELVFFPINEKKLEIMMEVDRRAKGLTGLLSAAFDMDESIIRFTLDESDLPFFRNRIEEILKKYS